MSAGLQAWEPDGETATAPVAVPAPRGPAAPTQLPVTYPEVAPAAGRPLARALFTLVVLLAATAVFTVALLNQ